MQQNKIIAEMLDISFELINQNSFSVLCHGFPVQENFMFSYKREGNNVTQSFGQPVDAKLIKFNVKYHF